MSLSTFKLILGVTRSGPGYNSRRESTGFRGLGACCFLFFFFLVYLLFCFAGMEIGIDCLVNIASSLRCLPPAWVGLCSLLQPQACLRYAYSPALRHHSLATSSKINTAFKLPKASLYPSVHIHVHTPSSREHQDTKQSRHSYAPNIHAIHAPCISYR